MKAGRELDALVAEKVMEIPWRHHHAGPGAMVAVLTLDDRYGLADGTEVDRYIADDLPRYSTNIADAWEVVEKMEDELEWSLESPTTDCDGYRMTFWGTGKDAGLRPPPGQATADTAPLAICLAALEAVGHPVEVGVS